MRYQNQVVDAEADSYDYDYDSDETDFEEKQNAKKQMGLEKRALQNGTEFDSGSLVYVVRPPDGEDVQENADEDVVPTNSSEAGVQEKEFAVQEKDYQEP
jgi:hypothetical protein